MSENIQVPPELRQILRDYTKAVIRTNPGDIDEFSRQYFQEQVGNNYEPESKSIATESVKWSVKEILASQDVQLPKLKLSSPDNKVSCEIFLFGATVTSWNINGDEKLFLSKTAILNGSKAIRGGLQSHLNFSHSFTIIIFINNFNFRNSSCISSIWLSIVYYASAWFR